MVNITDEQVRDKQESPDYLQALINSLQDELMVVDRDYRIVQVNEAVLARHGKARYEVIGAYCYDISHGLPELCRPPHHECPIKTVWETGNAAQVMHLHLYNVQGETRQRYLDIIATPIKDSQDKVLAVVEMMRDVTEAKEMSLKVAEANRTLSALNAIAGVVSQSLDLDSILSNALDKMLEVMDADTGGILLWNEEKQMMCYQIHHALSKENAQSLCCYLGEGISGKVAQTGESVLVEDISTDSRVIDPYIVTAKEHRAFASVPLRSKNKILGVLNIVSRLDFKFSVEDMELLKSIAIQIAIAVENAILHQEVRQQDESRGELLQEIFSIQEEERRRIARELHDETSQNLASLAASLEATLTMLPDNEESLRIKARLAELQALSLNSLDGIHKLIYELRPTLLDDLGLVAAVRWLADNNLRSMGIRVTTRVFGKEKRLSSRLEATIFRVIQEAIGNIARHARAMNAGISLHFRKGSIKIRITDDGRGFDVEEAIGSKDRPRGLGLIGMKERVELVNGVLKIRSRPEVEGTETEIDIEVPTD